MNGIFQKMVQGMLVPFDDDARELVTKCRVGMPVMLTLKQPRNGQFHRKFFALMHLAYDYWEPPEPDVPQHIAIALKHKGQTVNKNFDMFRKDICILAGYYDAFVRANGEVRLEAKSIKFGKMSQETFEKLYSDVIDVIIKRVCTQYTETEMRQQVENMILDFV